MCIPSQYKIYLLYQLLNALIGMELLRQPSTMQALRGLSILAPGPHSLAKAGVNPANIYALYTVFRILVLKRRVLGNFWDMAVIMTIK